MKIDMKYNQDRILLKDNFWLFLGFFLHGSFSYIYHFFMGRVLGPEDYGILGALLSITYLIMVFVQVIQLTTTKIVSDLKAQKKFLKITYFFKAYLKKIFIYACMFSFVLLILNPFLASFLKIKNQYLITLLIPFVIFVFLLALIRGVIQGLQRFKALAMNYFAEGFVKLAFGTCLVLLGYGVGGALGGIIASYLIAFTLAILSIKLTKKEEKFSFKPIYSTSIKTLIVLASLTFIYSIDVILIKHFFSDLEAGYYAALSTLGKIIFFASYSVSYVMFSKISEYKKRNKTKTLLNKSLVLVSIISLPILIFYFIFSEFSVKLLFGSSFLIIKEYLGFFGIYMFLFSLIYTLSFYKLSLDKKNFIYILLTFNFLEVILICLFHNSIIQIIYILLFLMLILLGILFYDNRSIKT